ncbi:hypothetical protein UQW22_06905 [Isoptericola halotolerans]|uniref:COG4315 family predicted lipoprotein n=1 Tax=Isoptericola halotolerans TaxID=300560 RepID=UPI00388EE776
MPPRPREGPCDAQSGPPPPRSPPWPRSPPSRRAATPRSQRRGTPPARPRSPWRPRRRARPCSPRRTASWGEIVVDGEGMTAYHFASEEPGSGMSTCEGDCLTSWPPVHAGIDEPPVEGVTAEVSTITGNDGEPQVTLDGRPVYLFAGDSHGSSVMRLRERRPPARPCRTGCARPRVHGSPG